MWFIVDPFPSFAYKRDSKTHFSMGLDIGKAMGSNIELSIGCIQGLRYRGILLEQPRALVR